MCALKYAPVTERLAELGGAKWALHGQAKALIQQGRDVILLTIGEPDVPTPPALIDRAEAAMRAGRIGYSNGRGEPALLDALAARYSARTGITFSTNRFLCFPGTQTALYAVLMGIAEPGCEVLVGDPMYATYEGLIRASGAEMVPVPLRPEAGFRMQAADVAARITPATRAIFLNTPHNPTGAVMQRDDIAAIGELARAHDLWILSDEVYEDLVYGDARFTSPLAFPELADRVIACASISKSHASPGFRSGWCVASEALCERLLPLSETMLFGNQPFIADMTAAALGVPDMVAGGMRDRLARRAAVVAGGLDGVGGLRVHRPEAGMFALLDVSGTGTTGATFAHDLLHAQGVAVMPGTSFGKTLTNWVRLGLTVDDARLAEAVARIAAHVASPRRAVSA
jgi:arginine:pyruvate transaminase